MSDASETTGTITITVPYITETSGFREPRPCSGAMADGRRFVGAVRDERSVLIAEADIGKAVLAAWPGEAPTGDKKRPTRFYLDTEFNEAPGVLDLISIALVCEDGREFYAVSSEFDESRCNDWVRANVLPKIAGEPRLTRAEIRDRIRAFVGDLTPEFWAYFADYDWVLFCWLFGAMVDLPKGWPMFCLDLKQVMHERGLTKANLPAQPDDSHHALADARWLREAHEVVRGYVAAKGRRTVAPTGERAKRLAEIGEWLARNDDETISDLGHDDAICELERAALDIVPTLLAEVTAADAALTAAGIHDDGRSLAERIAALAAHLNVLDRTYRESCVVRAAQYDAVAEQRSALALNLSRLLTLRVRFTDEQAAAEVTPEQANAYLAARGWTWLGAAIWNVWRREDEEVLVPTATEAHDYGEAMAHLINRLASTEGRSALAVWVDMTAKP